MWNFYATKTTGSTVYVTLMRYFKASFPVYMYFDIEYQPNMDYFLAALLAFSTAGLECLL